MPALAEAFQTAVVWLGVEAPAARTRRARALARASAAWEVTDPALVADTVRHTAREFRPDGVVAFSERVVHDAQRVAWEFGLPANSPETLLALQDKSVQRRRLREAGMPVPRQWVLASPDDCARAAAEAVFPAVLKPSVGMGSIATFRVERPEGLTALWRTAAGLARSDNRIAHRAPVLLLEEELRGVYPVDARGLGDYLSVEALIDNGRLHVLAVSDKLPLAPPFRENGHLLPTVRTEAELIAVRRCVQEAHRALGITHGASHTEIKLTAHGPRVIEVNGRIGGQVSEQLLLSAGYRLELEMARSSTGTSPVTDVSCDRYSAYLTPQTREGRYEVLDAPDAASFQERVPGLATVHHVVRPGDVVDSAAGTAANLCRVTVVADRQRDLLDLGVRLSTPEFFALRALRPVATPGRV
jgi:biotin carboxylase